MNKFMAIGGAPLIAAAAHSYRWYRGDAGKKPDLVPAATAKEEPRKTYYPNTEKLGKNEMRVISLGTGMPNQRKSQASASWLVDGILEMEDVIKGYYERQGVGDLYEEQVQKK
jgi:hypothetical protein